MVIAVNDFLPISYRLSGIILGLILMNV